MDNCIKWNGPIWSNGRYGMDKINGKSMTAHRAAWIRRFGPIPDGLVVCHACDNGLCVNTDHLMLGTMKANMLDCIKKKRFHYNTANQKGINNNNARPDYYIIRERAKYLRAKGWSLREIRDELNIKSNGHLVPMLK